MDRENVRGGVCLPDGAVEEHIGFDRLSVESVFDGPDQVVNLPPDQLLHPAHVAPGVLQPQLLVQDKIAVVMPQQALRVDDPCNFTKKTISLEKEKKRNTSELLEYFESLSWASLHRNMRIPVNFSGEHFRGKKRDFFCLPKKEVH